MTTILNRIDPDSMAELAQRQQLQELENRYRLNAPRVTIKYQFMLGIIPLLIKGNATTLK